MVGRVRRLDDGPFGRQRVGRSRATAGTAAISPSLYDRQQQGGRAAFVLHAPNEYSPKPGDLVCTGTSGPTWRHANSRTARRRIDSTASHCDIVTDVRGGYVQAIGGNVKDSVTMSLFPVDARGRLSPFAGKTWFMVVEKRV